ncbi:MAG: hypothetical protein OXU23_00400 [Candidatus Poribacteria bacterium]|nr:hypothetical protein [Candidatus Poribacteria bacterium]
MIGKLLPRNAFLLALMMLFWTICLLSMNLSADHHADHDNKTINNVDAQTSLGISYSEPFVKTGAYANIWNYSDISVRYYLSASLIVKRKGRTTFREKSDPDKGWVPAGESKSFFPSIDIDMTGARGGWYIANGSVSLELKFDFDGDGNFDEKDDFGSSAYLRFDIERF